MSFSFFGAPAKPAAKPRITTPDRVDRPAGRTAAAPAPKVIPNVKPTTVAQSSFTPGISGGGFTRNGSSISGQTYTPPATGDGSGQVDYGAQTVDNPAPMQPDLSDDALRKSTEYIARERAIQAMLDEFTQKQGTERTRYEGSYESALGELGYDPTKATFDLGELLTSGQRATTSGKAYNALRNDFAARGMLQSGAYQAAQGVLRNQLMKQREAIDKGRTTFLEDQNTALLGQQRAAEDQRKAALEAARQSILNSMGA